MVNDHEYVLFKFQVHFLGYGRARHKIGVVASVNMDVVIRLENHVGKRKRFKNFFLVILNKEDGGAVKPSVFAPEVSLGVFLGYAEKVGWSYHDGFTRVYHHDLFLFGHKWSSDGASDDVICTLGQGSVLHGDIVDRFIEGEGVSVERHVLKVPRLVG